MMRPALLITGMLSALGKRVYYGRDMVRALADPGTWYTEFIRQMRTIGVESVPLTVIVAAFLGGRPPSPRTR
ncbi:MAG: hypothetical protein ABI852_17990 [Gemmatimonadaceae bacterium]